MWSPGSPDKSSLGASLLQAETWDLPRRGGVSWGGMEEGMGCPRVSGVQGEEVPRCVGAKRRWAKCREKGLQ